MTLTQITEKGIKDSEILNADINASAAIAGTKISPDFGSQNIVTTGSITGNDLEIDSGTLSIDASNNRVGIGTTSPSTKFEVQTAAGERVQFLSNGSNQQPRIDLTRDAGIDFSIINAIGSYQLKKGSNKIYEYASDTHRFSIDGTEKVRLDSSGNVGIGTTSPVVPLDVQGGTGNTPIIVRSTDARVQISYVDNTTTGIGNVVTGAEGDDFFIRTGSDGAKKLTIKADGNVGIGTTSPGQKLEVRQTAASHAILAVNRPNSDTGALFLGNNSGNNAIIASNNTDLLFGRDSAGTFTERMRMRNDGGLCFNGDTAANNALDDYEEGTFTPTATFEASDDGNKAYSTQHGSYVKIGRLVHCNMVLVFSNRGTGSGRLRFNNLPFTVGDNISGTILEASATVGYYAGLISSVSGLHPVAINGTTQMVFYGILGTHAANTGDFGYSHVGNSFSIRLSLTYQT